MEIWDLYDRDRIKIGETMIRGNEVKKDTYRMVVHVCIFNREGKMLIQQRQPFKEGFPNMWDVTVGGSAVAGDSSQEAAEREVLEEIGYKLSLKGKRPSFTMNFDTGFDDFYMVVEDVDISKLSLQYEEVKDVKWASLEEIKEMTDRGEFIPYYSSFIELLFDMKDKMSTYRK